ncbi:MAG TPA: isoprenylcysteine carboxylmethyltransferase family protein [Bacteroidales bacterium]|nr:isoprenylcysteine carboxylmethyltransferase family protein [Bacteroidales bacterium]
MKAGYFIKHLSGTLVFFAILFISAGRADYWQGWVYVVISLIMFTLGYTLLKPESKLLAERSKPGKEVIKTDKIILGLSFLFSLTVYLTAGLDSGRYHWSPDTGTGLTVTGIILTATGQFLFLLAQKQNKFFSSTIRIQTDRGHTVCDKGLYSVIRHPAYLGSEIQSMGFPLLTGSLWCYIPSIAMIVLSLIRTSVEDKILMKELPGYREYSRKTRYRMLPYIW